MLGGAAPRARSRRPCSTTTLLLGTHRLRIVDRDRAVQPWLSADGRWALTYNGEIFNFAELARAVDRARATSCAPSSDTEVVLEGVLAWGEDALLRFRGEFAFATDRPADPPRVPGPRPRRGQAALLGARRRPAGRHVGGQGPGRSAGPRHRPSTRCPRSLRLGRAAARRRELHPYVDLLRLGEGQPMIEDLEEAIRTSSGAPTARRSGCGSTPTSPSASCCPAGWTAHWRSLTCARCTRTASRSPSAPRTARTSRTRVA